LVCEQRSNDRFGSDQERDSAECRAEPKSWGLTCNLGFLLNGPMTGGNKGVHDPSMLVFKHICEMPKIFHAAIADRAYRPKIFCYVHSILPLPKRADWLRI
jgi:hypothetical protein